MSKYTVEELKFKIDKLDSQLKNAENEKIKLEEQKKISEQRLKELTEEMAKYGVTPENIQDKLDELEKEISEGIENVESQMPEV